MEDLYVNFAVTISKLNKIIQRIKSLEISKYGLQPIHVSCCYYLSKNSSGLTAKELCELTIEDKAAISRALRTMQQKGYIEYDAHGRNEYAKLTKEGSKFADNINERIDSAVKAGSVNITDEERTFFYKFLLDISNNLINYYHYLLKNEDEKNE